MVKEVHRNRLDAETRIQLTDYIRKNSSNGVADFEDTELVDNFYKVHSPKKKPSVVSVKTLRNALGILSKRAASNGGFAEKSVMGNPENGSLLKLVLAELRGLRRDLKMRFPTKKEAVS